jgi:hypothetical protein
MDPLYKFYLGLIIAFGIFVLMIAMDDFGIDIYSSGLIIFGLIAVCFYLRSKKKHRSINFISNLH